MSTRGFLRLSNFRSRPLRLKSRSARGSVSLLDAMNDPHLFGPWFRNRSTWRAWRVFLRALFGLPLARSQRAIFQKHTGRTEIPTKQAREAWLVVGRRGGKSFITALVAVFLSCFRDYRKYLAPGERATVAVVAADRRQARTVMRYIEAMLTQIPMLQRMVVRLGMESIELDRQVVIEIHTCSFRSTRGYSIAAAIADEVAFWRDESSATPDTEVLNALRPGMASIPGAMLLCLSSPYARRGALWESYERHYGQENDPILVWQADTLSMNPTLPEHIVNDAFEADPIAASAEYGGQFRSDVEGFLQPEWLTAAVQEGLHEIPPQPGTSYTAFCDPSGGSQDAMTLGISHAEGKRVILDLCRAWTPPFDPAQVCREIAATLRTYGLSTVTGDRYSAEWVVSAFREHAIYYEGSQRTKSEIYLETLPLFATAAVALLDNRQLLNELRGLERRTGSAKDIVDHQPRSHDDLANSACGALLLAVRRQPVDMKNAEVVTTATSREQRDAHIVNDLGYIDTMADPDSPWKL